MFTFVVAIGIGVMFAVVFAVQTAWAVPIAVGSGFGSMVVTVLLCRLALRNDKRRSRAMSIMFWMTGR